MVNYENYKINGINESGATEQRVICPECPPRSNKNERDLCVNLEKQAWFCHHCGWAGSLLAEKEDAFVFQEIKKPAVFSDPIGETAINYFQSRGITRDVLGRNEIKISAQNFGGKGEQKACFAFPYKIGEKLVNIKYRTIGKDFKQANGKNPVLYKINDLVMQDEIIITEGEIDALSFEVIGYKNAGSVPNGAIQPGFKNVDGQMAFLTNSLPYIAQAKKIYLALDKDLPGRLMAKEIARRLGKAKCWMVEFPADCKDANDVLVKYGNFKLKKCLEEATSFPVEGVFALDAFYNDIDDIHARGFPDGAKTGRWSDFDNKLSFHSKHTTIITGVPNHGKSPFLDNLMINQIMRHGWKFAIFSPENGSPSIHFTRLAEIISGKPFLPGYSSQMTAEELNRIKAFLSKYVYFVKPGSLTFSLDDLLDAYAYLISKYGINAVVLDPWNALEHHQDRDESETKYIGRVLNQIRYFSQKYDVHTYIVAHPTKVPKQKDSSLFEIPTAYSISGSANWFNIPEAIICVYRQFSENYAETKYTKLCIQKVKFKYMGSTGFVKFHFDVANQRYHEYLEGEHSYDCNSLLDFYHCK